jgi:hypothetical protein
VAETVGEGGGNDCRGAVGAVPRRYPDGLFGTSIPLACDDAEERETTGFEEAEEKAGGEEAGVAVARCHARLRYSPPEHEAGHENAVGDFDDQDGREWLPGELGDGGNGSDEGVLVAGEMRVFLEAKDGAIAEHRLVEDLEEVDPHQDGQDDFVRLASDSFVLASSQIWCLRRVRPHGFDLLHRRSVRHARRR